MFFPKSLIDDQVTDCVTLSLFKHKIKNKKTHDNLTKTERQALKSLREKKHLVFQKPDKSCGVVVINKHDYIHEGEAMVKVINTL